MSKQIQHHPGIVQSRFWLSFSLYLSQRQSATYFSSKVRLTIKSKAKSKNKVWEELNNSQIYPAKIFIYNIILSNPLYLKSTDYGFLIELSEKCYLIHGPLEWLEDGSPPQRLLVPLWWPHQAEDQFCTTQGVRVGHGCGAIVTRTPVHGFLYNWIGRLFLPST